MISAENAKKLVKTYEEKAAEQHKKDILCFCELFGQKIYDAASKGRKSVDQAASRLPNGITADEFSAVMTENGYTIQTYTGSDRIYVCWGEE